MSMSDSTQLQKHVTANFAVDIDPPTVKAVTGDHGTVNLFVGPLLLTFSPEDAANLAASLASVAATAMVNNVLRLVTE